MADEPKPTRPWWRRKRTIAAVLLWLALLYPLSQGPAAWIEARGWLRPETVHAPYRPLRPIASAVGLEGHRSAYLNWWWRLGLRNPASD